MKSLQTTLIVLVLSVFAACGGEEETPAAAPKPAPVAPKPQPPKPEDPTAKMARAVASGKGGAAVELRYDVLNKPEAGKEIDIELALIPGAMPDSMTVSVTPSPGLEVIGQANASFGALKVGDVARHAIKVRASKPEVVYLTVTATLYALNISSVRSFAIPIIFSDAPPPPSVAPQAAAPNGKPGEKVESMPAREK